MPPISLSPLSHRATRLATKGVAALIIAGTTIASCALIPPTRAYAAVSDWQKGVDMVPSSPTDFGSASFDQSVENAATLGVNYITLNIPLYQTSVSTTDVQTGPATPTDQSLESAIQFIHSKGLHVMLKFNMYPDDGQWSALINPSDRATWFANYGALVDHYATIAQSTGVEQICLGTELIDMSSATVNPTNTQNWENLISGVRKIYSGALTYEANWGSGANEETTQVQFWSALDYISISAYYNLSGDGSVNSLMQSWDSWNQSDITPLENQWHKPIVFGEIGYMSIFDSYEHPWMWQESGTADPTQQANDYQALFQYWNNYPWLAGVDLWNWSTNPNAGGPNDDNYTPQNKSAENVMQTWFAGAQATTTAPIFSATATVSPAAPTPGQAASFTLQVNDANAGASNTNVDAEIYNSSGQQVYQRVISNETFASGETKTFTITWTPSAAGTYTLKTGVFSGDWQTLYYWNDNTLQFGVASAAEASGGTIDVWWPTNGSSVSGVQPFQAMLENASVDTYNMYWQVDGGQLNAMPTNNANYPHKEASVDVSPWNWQPSGAYTITFVAQTLDGQPIATSSVVIHVNH